jgi:hypothetical protein
MNTEASTQEQTQTQVPEQVPATAQVPQTQEPTVEKRLVDIPISDENVALNLMVSFLALAHKRGTFTIEESAKIWECIRRFQR